MRLSLLPRCCLTSAAVFASCFVSGCGKIPTWSELTSGKTQTTPAQPVTAPQPAQPIPQPVAVPEPAKPGYAEVIANFKKTPPGMLDNAALASLTSMDEQGRELVTEINASSSKVTDEGLAQLSKLPSLRSLELAGTAVSDNGCASIAQVPTLETLTLTGSQISEKGVAHLVNLPQLKVLKIDGTRLTNAGWEIVGRFPALEELSIDNSSLNDAAMEAVCEATTLRNLQMNDTNITEKGLASLKKLEQLTHLRIGGCPVTCAGLANAIKGNGLKSLINLSVQRTQINDKGAAAIGAIKSLQELNIGHLQNMQDRHFSAMVKGKKHLRWINFGHNPNLTSAALAALKGAEELEVVQMGECPLIDDRGLVYLAKLKNLKRLDYNGTRVTEAGIRKLKGLIPGLNEGPIRAGAETGN